ncbi:hypothetical protein [Dyadobacter sp. CY343]|nr:hypothetical protein [Dyadobacter sp. CY343]
MLPGTVLGCVEEPGVVLEGELDGVVLEGDVLDGDVLDGVVV